MKYKIIDKVTSDVMLEIHGNSLKKLFENAAEALLSIICEIKKVKPLNSKKVSIKKSNTEDLMFSWLQQLIARVDIDEMFFSKFKIKKITEKELTATIYGEPISPEKGRTVVKSVTNHKFKLEKNNKGYKVFVVLDI